MRFVVASNGSHGDVHPFFGIARALAARGHDVTIVSNERYADLAGGVDFVAGATAAELEELLDRFDVRASFASMGTLVDGLMVRPVEGFYERIRELHVPGETTLVAFPMVLAARLAHDALGAPLVTCNLAPSMFPSMVEPPRMGASELPQRLPATFHRVAHGLIALLMGRLLRPVNERRRALGLAPVRRWARWIASPQKILGLFPPWFAEPAPDWPAHAELTDFPLFDGADAAPLPAELDRFLAEGTAPVVFTAGTPAKGVAPFFAACAEAARRVGVRAVLLTRYADDVPRELPDGVVHASYAPFGELLPRSAAVVHHGGIGTCGQALRAGKPQLVVPWGVDQFDQALRVRRLGVGEELPFRRVTAERLADALAAILSREDVARAAASVATRFGAVDPLASTCERLEAFAESSRAGGAGR